MSENTVMSQLSEVASRIKGTREIMGWSTSKMAKKTEISENLRLNHTPFNPFIFVIIAKTEL